MAVADNYNKIESGVHKMSTAKIINLIYNRRWKR